jgi:hypothetical protein
MAESSVGVQVQYSTDDTNWSGMGCLLEADFGGVTKEVGETQCLSATSNRYKTFVGKWVDPGEGTFTIDWDKNDFAAILAMADDVDPLYWRFVIPDGDPTDVATCSQLKFQGLVTRLGITFPTDGDRIGVPVTLKFSGPPTFTEAP